MTGEDRVVDAERRAHGDNLVKLNTVEVAEVKQVQRKRSKVISATFKDAVEEEDNRLTMGDKEKVKEEQLMYPDRYMDKNHDETAPS